MSLVTFFFLPEGLISQRVGGILISGRDGRIWGGLAIVFISGEGQRPSNIHRPGGGEVTVGPTGVIDGEVQGC